MRIGGKLLTSFGSIGALVAGLSGFAIWQLGSINSLTDEAVNNRMPKMVAAQELNAATSAFRIAEAQHILAVDPANMAAAEARMRQMRATVDKDVATLDATVHKPKGRALLDRFHAAWPEFLDEQAQLVDLSRQEKKEEATALMRGRSQRSYEALSDTAEGLAAFEADLAHESGANAASTYQGARLLCLLAVLIVFAGLGVVLTLLVRTIARPIAAMTGALGELAGGNMAVVVPVEDRADEVGDLAKAMKGLRDQLAAAERSKQEQTALIVDSIGQGLARLADGDLVSRIEADLTGPFAKLKIDFNDALGALQTVMRQVRTAAEGIDGGADSIRQASDDLSHRTEQQAASLEETAAAMDQITATVRKTAENAGHANNVVSATRGEAERGGEVVRRAVGAMAGIERASAEISEIISVIDGIAFQTNLLALNAGVEAARAGDAGRGFAVVASEVRALAQRSADAAKDVKARITASGEQVAMGVALVNDTGGALGSIIERIGEIKLLVSEIALSSEQQATGLQQVNLAVADMDGVTQQNAAMVEEATAAARGLSSEAGELTRRIARFQTGAAMADPRGATVHTLPTRAAEPARRTTKPASRRGAPLALVQDDDWSAF